MTPILNKPFPVERLAPLDTKDARDLEILQWAEITDDVFEIAALTGCHWEHVETLLMEAGDA